MITVAKHRHSVTGGYTRGEETRVRIIAAAMRLFGEKGYEGASTRDIAAAAGVNAPALQYYFDNKEGVLRACIEYIAERAWESLSGVVLEAERLTRAGRLARLVADRVRGGDRNVASTAPLDDGGIRGLRNRPDCLQPAPSAALLAPVLRRSRRRPRGAGLRPRRCDARHPRRVVHGRLRAAPRRDGIGRDPAACRVPCLRGRLSERGLPELAVAAARRTREPSRLHAGLSLRTRCRTAPRVTPFRILRRVEAAQAG